MKLTNLQMINIIGVFNTISNADLPIKLSYAISKKAKKLERELEPYNIERKKLISKNCTTDEEGNPIVEDNGNMHLKEECIEDFNIEHKELLDIEVEIDIHKIKEIDLLSSNINIAPAQLMTLDCIIEE